MVRTGVDEPAICCRVQNKLAIGAGRSGVQLLLEVIDVFGQRVGLGVFFGIGGHADLESVARGERRHQVDRVLEPRRHRTAGCPRPVPAQREDPGDAGLPEPLGGLERLGLGQAERGEMRGDRMAAALRHRDGGLVSAGSCRPARAHGHREPFLRHRGKPVDRLFQRQALVLRPRREQFEPERHPAAAFVQLLQQRLGRLRTL